MTKMLIDIDEDTLEVAAQQLGTTTKKDTVNAALHQAATRRSAEGLERLGRLFDEGVLDASYFEDKRYK